MAMVLAVGFCCLFWFMARWQPLNPSRLTKEKLAPFECGSDPIGSPRGRYSVKFYQVAILFLVFDIEAAFMYPWAVKYRDLSFPKDAAGNAILLPNGQPAVSYFGFGEMLVFVAILGVALAYVWRKKAIGWD
jgi:NADH-quinone oxidoreductase subunit A